MKWLLVCVCAVLLHCVLAAYPRPVSKVLQVRNGGKFGKWRTNQFCPVGSYVNSFQLKVQPDQGTIRDDTALNAIKLGCTTRYTLRPAGYIFSHESKWGSWTPTQTCERIPNMPLFISGFRMKIEGPRGVSDDTAANNIRFFCRPLHRSGTYELPELKGGKWGTYGPASGECPVGSAVCGIQVESEDPQGFFGDDTALNDAKFYCCP